MKILVVTQVFYPEQFRINEIVPELIKMGHEVTVLTEYPNYPEGEIYEGYGFDIPYEDNYFGAKIVRLKARPRHQGKFNLAKNYASFWFKGCAWVRKHGKKYDLCYCPQLSPVFMAYPCVTAKKKFHMPFILNVQDMWPESFMCVMHTNNKLIYKVLEFMSNIVYKNADKVLCSSHSFMNMLETRGVKKEKLYYWPQFAEEINNIEYECPKEYKTKYRFTFTGNVGEAQGLDIIIKVAELLKEEKDIGFYIVGDGSSKEKLEKIVKEKILTNIIFIGRKPKELMPNYIKNATACLLILEDTTISRITVPAKLQMYMACGVPIINIIQGEVAQIIDKSNCGVNVGSDINKIAFELLNLVNMTEEEYKIKVDNGKRYVDKNNNKRNLIKELGDILAEFNV